MSSVRARLTFTYAAALVGTMAVFGAALLGARRSSAYRDLDDAVLTQADLALRVIEQAREEKHPVIIEGDSVSARQVSPFIRAMLDALPNYLLVLDDSGRFVYGSLAVQELGEEDLASLKRGALSLTDSQPAGLVDLSRDELYIRVRFDREPRSVVSRVVVAAPSREARRAPTELVTTMVLLAPALLAVSVAIAYVIAGRAMRPIDSLINEVEAITDGRSLHRRLPVEEPGDEVERLAATLNAMIGRLETSFGGLRRFTADASHELKTPLTVLRTAVERAMSPHVHTDEKLIALEEALHETARMSDLVDSLLTLARYDEGRFDLHREPVDLEPLVREVMETATILGEAAGLEVRLAVIEPATVLGDRTRLRQLFLNLVTNAIKYTPTGGSVELALSRRLDAITFSVRDTGVGISAADLPYVFERFWRADRARSRRSGDGMSERGGFGLGLAISQWIAQAHGGTLTVQSRLGRGSTFTVSLPGGDVVDGVEQGRAALLPAAAVVRESA